MADTEKGRREGDPIPKDVWRDALDSKVFLLNRQTSWLTRRVALSATMAAIVASLMYGEVSR